MVAVALSIAGADPSGGAGIQADLKTFHAHGVYGQAVLSLLTVQSTRGVSRVVPVSDELISAQLSALWDDIPPLAAKTGALPSAGAVQAIAGAFRGRACPLVVDPVLHASSGKPFAADAMVEAYRAFLMPVAALLTPNAPEAEALTGISVRDRSGAERAARALIELGAQAVLVKGGHLAGDPVDVLLVEDGTELRLPAPRVNTLHTHGTGCTYSAAITAQLALGRDLPGAVQRAKRWLNDVLARPLELGVGRGPLNHFVPVPP